MRKHLTDIVEAIEDFFFVETKDQEIKPFFLNVIQRQFVAALLHIFKTSDRPLRLIILKGRQFGFSTLILAAFFCKCMIVPNTRAAVISHDIEATKKLFRRVKFFASTLLIKPSLDKESEREYSFPKTNSYFYIGTAGAKAFGRGDNLTDVHCSEVAFWQNAAAVMNGLVQAVGKTGTIIIETTANGVGNYFHKLWKKSWQNTKAAWIALFFCWTDFDEYEMEPEQGFARDEHEEYLVRRYLSKLPKAKANRKLAWRRWKISETEDDKGLTPEQIFQQEYPFSPREAFISSGRSVFSLRALEAYKTKPPIDEEDGLKIWKKPSGYSIMAIDTSEGLENNDRAVIDIYDENLEQVAQWAGWCDPDELGAKSVKFATIYKSYIICEVNNMGIETMRNITKRYPVSMIYQRERFDEVYQTIVFKPGWRTDKKTKPILVATLQQFIRKHDIKFNCQETVDECMSFIKNGKGGYEADAGANDDRVITPGMAIQAYMVHPPRKKMLTAEGQDQLNIEKANAKWRADKRKKQRKKSLTRK